MFWFLTTLYTGSSSIYLVVLVRAHIHSASSGGRSGYHMCGRRHHRYPRCARVPLSPISQRPNTQSIGVAQPAPLSCGLHSRSGYLLQRYASATWIAPVCFECTPFDPVPLAGPAFDRLADGSMTVVMLVITLAKVLPRWTWGGKAGLLGSGGNLTCVSARSRMRFEKLMTRFDQQP